MDNEMKIILDDFVSIIWKFLYVDYVIYILIFNNIYNIN